MKWVVDPNCRCDFVFYSGLNCSGLHQQVKVFPSGRQGDVSTPFQSVIFAARPGIRAYFCTDMDDDAWIRSPWRCVRPVKGLGLVTRSGMPYFRVNDLDLYGEPHLLRLPHGMEEGFPLVAHPEDGEGWTFGLGGDDLKGNIAMIRIEKEP